LALNTAFTIKQVVFGEIFNVEIVRGLELDVSGNMFMPLWQTQCYYVHRNPNNNTLHPLERRHVAATN
jgi:hypothetical protein